MNKILFLVTALLAMVQQSTAQTNPVITVADVEAKPGETVAFSLNLSGGRVDLYKSLQFDVQFPATGFTTTGDYEVAEEWPHATAVIGDVDEFGLARVPFASADAITAADVDNLVSVNFTVANTVAVGEYDVTLKNIFLGYNTADKDYPDDVTFKVKVVERHTVVLDETSTTVPADATGVDVTVKRTIKADEWSTICLPFAMTAEQISTAFSPGAVELADFTGVETKTDADENIIGIKVNFTDATAIEANHPYMIKVSNISNDITEFTVEDVDIQASDEPSVDQDEWITGSGTKKDPYVYHYNSFVGSYVAQTTIPDLCLFLSGNKFWYSNGSTKMKAFRGYFDFYDVLTEVEGSGARIGMSFNDETTGISDATRLNNNEQIINNNWYDLSGRRISVPSDSSVPSVLPKGVYIKEGRKIVIK